MRKLKSLIAIAGLLALPLLGASVSAADCTITNTGPGSNNTCTNTSTYRCEVVNDNVVIYDSNNQQVATSGSANNSGNTGSEGVTSGSATNSNGTTFNYTLTNESCTVATVTTPAPEQPVGGSGSAGAATPAPAVAAKPTVLAKTSGDVILPAFIAVATVLAAATLGVRAYSVIRSRQ